MIDRHLSNIEKSLNNNNFQSAFQLIFELKKKYPQSKRIEVLFEKNKLKYIKKMRVSSNEIEQLQLNTNQHDVKIKIDKFLKIEPNNAYLNSCLGNYYGQIDQLKQSRIYHERSILLNPYEIAFYINLSETYKFLGNITLSKIFLEYALLLEENNKLALVLYARALFNTNNLKQSLFNYQKLISSISYPENFKYKVEYFHRLIDSSNTEKAKLFLDEMKKEDNEKNNRHEEDINYLEGTLNIELKEYLNAVLNFEKCLSFNINNSYVYSSMAVVFERQNHYDKAINYLKKSISLDSNNVRALNNLGIIYSHLGNIKEGISLLENSLKIDPYNNEIKYVLGQLQIYNKKFKEGWKYFRSRWLYSRYKHKPFKSSKNLLSNISDKKNVFVWAEQGIGDQIMYGSMFSEMANLSKKLIVQLDKRLIKIFKNKHSNIKFIGDYSELKEEEFDFHLPFGNLGAFLRNDLSSFKNSKKPYVDFDKQIAEKVKKKYKKNNLLIGISWTSHNGLLKEDKSVYLKNLIPILKLKNVNFIDLEYKNSGIEKNEICKQIGVKINSVKEIDIFNDMLGLASIISACDLVITCSNLNAHMAGALNKKTYLLLPLGKGRLWNWGSTKDRSVWYPSVKIFQQLKPGDWSDPIVKVKKEIINCQNY